MNLKYELFIEGNWTSEGAEAPSTSWIPRAW